ncbi:hypothetical protein ACJJIQ_05130 [Microbulbifer sp. ANSA003]|uniref:hypothetical protein n=1 Tax=Microbulbifer sp. ANSA003 TaxID=3243360 RepID=UPI00404307D5
MNEFSFKPAPYSLQLHPVNANLIDKRISVLKDAFLKVENIHKSEYDTMCDRYREVYDDPEMERVKELLSDDIRELDHFFFRVHRVGAILGLYAFLENSMTVICRQKDEEFGQVSSRDKGIVRCKQFLSNNFEAANFGNGDLGRLWSKIVNFQILRNSLAHTEGNTELLKPERVSKLENTDGLYFEGEDVIMIERHYVLESMGLVRDFLVEVLKISDSQS